MKGENFGVIIGHVGKEPETRSINKTDVASFSVAFNKQWKNGEKVEEKTIWIPVKAWAGLAGIVKKYVSKGSRIYVRGEMNTYSYDRDGETMYGFELVASDIVLLDGRQ